MGRISPAACPAGICSERIGTARRPRSCSPPFEQPTKNAASSASAQNVRHCLHQSAGSGASARADVILLQIDAQLFDHEAMVLPLGTPETVTAPIMPAPVTWMGKPPPCEAN